MAKDATTVAQRWSSNLAGSTQKIKDGVDAVTVSPTTKAAASSAKYLAGVQKAVASNKWQRGLQSVSLADWQKAMTDKGLARVGQGAQAAQPKMQQFFTQLLPYVESNRAAIHAMPNLTLQDSIARASAWITAMSKFSYKK